MHQESSQKIDLRKRMLGRSYSQKATYSTVCECDGSEAAKLQKWLIFSRFMLKIMAENTRVIVL